MRQYNPKLFANKEVYNLAAKCILPNIKFVQRQYPSLKGYKLAALMHSAYAKTVNLCPAPHERPVSLTVRENLT